MGVKTVRRLVRDYAGITAGAFLTAAGLDIFLIPNKIAAGGVSGAATVLHYLLGVPVGLTMLALNVPLFLLSVKVLGAKFGLNTLYGAAVLAVATDVIARFAPVLTHDLLLGALYGGVVVGVGMGLVFRFNGTTAGTDLAAAVINRLFHMSVGKALLTVDFFVIASAGLAFRSAELAMYALISLFVTSKVIDLIQEGQTDAKAFFIISVRPQEIGERIMRDLERGVTFLKGRGGYTMMERDVLFCVVGTAEVNRLRELVQVADPRAFVIVTDARDVLGEGFRPMSLQK